MPARLLQLVRKLAAQANLLRTDPEQLGRNLGQFTTNPEQFQQRLIDVHHPTPMHVAVQPDGPLRLNVLDTHWRAMGMTGGPNTVINLAARIAQQGIAVRMVATVGPADLDPAWFDRHVTALLGTPAPDLPIATAGDPANPLPLGPRDLFMATHWSTAQQIAPILPRLATQQFFYMLQEFEPGFYAWSSNYARAIETFDMDFHPIVNERTLAEYLFTLPFGRLAHPETRARAMVFEPAVDATLFRPAESAAPTRRLLFYARPTNARNMFGLGLMALRQAAAHPVFRGWQFQSIGARGSVPAFDLGSGHTLRPAPWVDYAGYGDLLRGADILLCPMLSPHTSYPVLEMAACGGRVVTNTFATKTAPALRALSDAIIPTPPTAEGLAEGLITAAQSGRAPAADLHMPREWSTSLAPVARSIAGTMRALAD